MLRLAYLCATFAPVLAAEKQLRSLQDDRDSQSRDYYYNDDDLVDRVEQDVNEMWTLSPSEWNIEEWEVFAAFLLCLAIVLCCLCCVLCIIPCCLDDSPERVVMTAEEWKDKNKNLLENQSDTDASSTKSDEDDNESQKIFKVPSTSQVSEAISAQQPPVETQEVGDQNKTSGVQEESTRPESKQQWDRAYFVAKEVVGVWSEFLGFESGKDAAKQDYKRHMSKRRSRRKRRSDRFKVYSDTENMV